MKKCNVKGCKKNAVSNWEGTKICVTHYHKNKMETDQAYYNNHITKARIWRDKQALQPIISTLPDEDTLLVNLSINEIVTMSEVEGKAWRTLLNDMIEGNLIQAWKYDPTQDLVSMRVFKTTGLALSVDFNQIPQGVFALGTTAKDTVTENQHTKAKKERKNEQTNI